MANMNTSTNDSRLLAVAFDYREHQKQKDLITHLNNLLNDLNGIELAIEVVAYGPGIFLLMSEHAEFREEIASLQGHGVAFNACRNAMNSHGVVDDDLLDGVGVVPSGVGRLTKAQLDGAIYLKE